MNGEEEKSYWVNAALGHIKKKKKNSDGLVVAFLKLGLSKT